MLDPKTLARQLNPSKTVLFLGAGASAPSGAPLAAALASQLATMLTGVAAPSSDLTELSGILEMKVGRPALVQALRTLLVDISPTGGLLSLPYFPWAAIYSTNYDTLVEKAYKAAGSSIVVVRSNYDYHKVNNIQGTPLFKIHGCITQDIVDGHDSRMILTERDYDEYEKYREVLFNRLQLDLNARDVLIIGHSLRDAHLRNAVKRASELKRSAGAPGKIHLPVFEHDEDRAALVETYGVSVAFGGIDDILAALEPQSAPLLTYTLGDATTVLPPALLPRVVDVAHAIGLQRSPERLYAGAPASFGDIHQKFTFERSCERRLLEALTREKICVAIIGIAGAGKTTLARRLAVSAHTAGMNAWELGFGMQLDAKSWLEVAAKLPENGPMSVLLVDDCTTQQRQVNLLMDGLAEMKGARLRLILTAQTSQWEPRTKSPRIFRRGIIEPLGRLDGREIDALLDLLDRQPEIRKLAGKKFLEKNRRQRMQTLKSRCAADMFVALKYLFSTDAIDTILLREYAELQDDLQDIYRLVAGLEAAGARVHRQLVIRLLGVRAELLRSHLAVLDGLIEEFDISPDQGLYGWRTRHEVVAGVIARYKLADEETLVKLLDEVIDALNPTLFIEQSTANAICLSELGIRRVGSRDRRVALYEKLISVAPLERIPRHRLIREHLDAGRLHDAEVAIADAVRAVGIDSPLRRYKVLLLVARATDTEGLMDEDRVALIAEARKEALDVISVSPEDKYSYTTLGHVAQARYDLTGHLDYYDEALDKMRRGYQLILDPLLQRTLDEWERKRLPLKPRPD